MKSSIETDAYIDGVVAYHQIRDALDLTLPEAREFADTLEVFEELSENVASNPELRLAYIGVIRSRGQNRTNAIDTVRTIEKQIAELMWDVEAISDRTYDKTLTALADDKDVKKRANTFVKLFKPVIPSEELPATKRRKTSTRKSQQVIEPEEVTEAPMPMVEPEPKQRSTPETFVPFYERQRSEVPKTAAIGKTGDWQAMRFASQLLRWVGNRESELTSPDEPGFRWVPMAKSIAEASDISLEDAKIALRNFKASGDLHVVDKRDGTRIMSINPPAAKAGLVQQTRQENVETTEREIGFDEQEWVLVGEIITSFKRAHADQGIKLKSFWVDDWDKEPVVRSVVRKLEKLGIVNLFQPRRQRAIHSRRNTDPFVRTADLALWRACKDDPQAVLRQIQNQLVQAKDRATI